MVHAFAGSDRRRDGKPRRVEACGPLDRAAPTPERIELAPQDNKLGGASPVAIPADVKGVVQLTGPDGKTAQGRYH